KTTFTIDPMKENFVYILVTFPGAYGCNQIKFKRFLLGNPNPVMSMDVDPSAAIVYNSSGGLAWFNRYDGTGSGEDFPIGMTIDANNNIYITGYSKNAGTGNDITTIKYNQTGALLWEKRYNFSGVGNDYGASVAADNNGNVYVTGYSLISNNNYDYITIKYSQGQLFGKLSHDVPEKFKLY